MNSEIIKDRNIKVLGIDTNKSYITRARHALIDNDLDNWIKLLHIDNYNEMKINTQFDYIVFSDSYSVIPNINNTLRYYERFMKDSGYKDSGYKDSGYMVVTSTLFDEYNQTIDLVKKNLRYGTMMLKSDLEEYIKQDRQSDDYDFKICKQYNLSSTQFNSYIVRWKPGSE